MSKQALWRGRLGPGLLALATLSLSLVLMLTNHDVSTYSCRGSAIVDVFNPEPEASAAFRAHFFDPGHACNRDARIHVGAAAVVLLVGGGLTALWLKRRSD